MFEVLKEKYKGKKVLITGNTGFKGSWLSICLLEMDADVLGYALEPYTKNDNYVICNLEKKHNQIIADIRDKKKLEESIIYFKPEIIFHLAAQPLVLESYQNPAETFEINVIGTVNVLDIAKKYDFIKAIINVTSDKCYDNKEWIWGYRENDAMGGKDPYSASKGAAELVFNAYYESFYKQSICAIASVRAGNVIGGGDWAMNRIIPDFFKAYISKNKLSLRNPNATRPWQFVLEPLVGYLILGSELLSKNGKQFEGAWNFGPKPETHKSVLNLIEQIKQKKELKDVVVEFEKAVFHEAHFLKLDITKATTNLNWKPLLTFEQTIEFTTQGYLDEINNKNIYTDRVNQINSYFSAYN